MNVLKYPHTLWPFSPDYYSAARATCAVPDVDDELGVVGGLVVLGCNCVSGIGTVGFSPWREEVVMIYQEHI